LVSIVILSKVGFRSEFRLEGGVTGIRQSTSVPINMMNPFFTSLAYP